jgi:hypothetical protein
MTLTRRLSFHCNNSVLKWLRGRRHPSIRREALPSNASLQKPPHPSTPLKCGSAAHPPRLHFVGWGSHVFVEWRRERAGVGGRNSAGRAGTTADEKLTVLLCVLPFPTTSAFPTKASRTCFSEAEQAFLPMNPKPSKQNQTIQLTESRRRLRPRKSSPPKKKPRSVYGTLAPDSSEAIFCSLGRHSFGFSQTLISLCRERGEDENEVSDDHRHRRISRSK